MEVTLTPKIQWSGIVKIDNSIDDYVKNVEHLGTTKRFQIKDVKYHHDFWNTPDCPPNVYGWPREVSIWLRNDSDLQEYMNCDAFLGYYREEKIRGFIRKEKYYEDRLVAKGFRLEPVINPQTKIPVLASYRANIGSDNAFNIEQKGISCYCSGSQSSEYEGAYKSLTCVFIASDEKPFVAYVRKKGMLNKMICNNDGIKEISQDKGREEPKKKPLIKPTEDPLTVLKLRLAKGEITKEEYEELRNTLKD